MRGVRRLLLNHQHDLFRYAMQLCSDEHVAWDLLQETSVRILTHDYCYSEQGGFLPWARTVMRHIFFNRQKRLLRRSFLFADDYSGLQDTPLAVASESTDCFYLTNEILAMIDMLPSHQSRAFHLFVDGHSYADIAARMSVSVDNVRNYIHAARVALRRKLDRE